MKESVITTAPMIKATQSSLRRDLRVDAAGVVLAGVIAAPAAPGWLDVSMS